MRTPVSFRTRVLEGDSWKKDRKKGGAVRIPVGRSRMKFDAFEKKNWLAGPALQGLQTWDESKQNFFQSKFNFRVSAEGGEQYHG